ncbi:hypothetical protein HOLleu_19353 [Holothuria leucospilota]|uniref:Uncharacterized protein n=1 Tax=Holothuria leucospilota TaxID=206669 RepID=A0A9Q1BZW7_HOLLE|nr:hypothetical protein HOLleu_19353 [Holothuria leucospilota]
MEILLKVLCSSMFFVFLEIFLFTEGAKLPTKPTVTLCAKYRNEPKSGWSSLPKICLNYLQSLEGDPSTAEPNTQSPRVPLNIGEKEVEIEVEREGKNELDVEKEIEIEKENEVEFESDFKCRGSKCTTDGTTGKNGGTNGNPSTSFSQELLRTIAILGMAAVIGVTVVAIAVLLICLLRRRGESSQPVGGRKDYTRNGIRDQHNGAVGRYSEQYTVVVKPSSTNNLLVDTTDHNITTPLPYQVPRGDDINNGVCLKKIHREKIILETGYGSSPLAQQSVLILVDHTDHSLMTPQPYQVLQGDDIRAAVFLKTIHRGIVSLTTVSMRPSTSESLKVPHQLDETVTITLDLKPTKTPSIHYLQILQDGRRLLPSARANHQITCRERLGCGRKIYPKVVLNRTRVKAHLRVN